MPRNSGIPHYQKIADALLSRSMLPAGKMPSERALARRFKVARNTARRALEELRKRGMVTRIQGSGTFPRARAERLVLGFGYRLDFSHFARLFEWLGHRLAENGFQLLNFDLGLRGELAKEVRQYTQSLRPEAIFWLPSSHPSGLRVAMQIRRKFSSSLPLLLVNDPLGLSLQGPHHFDLVHFDYAQAAQRLVERLFASGYHRPVLVRRSDVTVFSSDEARKGFLAALFDRGISDLQDHIIDWDVANAGSLKSLKSIPRGSRLRPDAFVLPYPCQEEFRRSLRQIDVSFPQEMPMIAFGQEDVIWRAPINFRYMAEVCADLLVGRLRNPKRINLRVAIPLPILGRRQSLSPPAAANISSGKP